jgi:hypothetical protein
MMDLAIIRLDEAEKAIISAVKIAYAKTNAIRRPG